MSASGGPALRRDALPHRRDRGDRVDRDGYYRTRAGIQGSPCRRPSTSTAAFDLNPRVAQVNRCLGENGRCALAVLRNRGTRASGTFVGLLPSLSTVKQDNLVTAPVFLPAMSETGSLQHRSAQGGQICHGYRLDANNALVTVAVPSEPLFAVPSPGQRYCGEAHEDDLPRPAVHEKAILELDPKRCAGRGTTAYHWSIRF